MPSTPIENKIYVFRGQKVMIDSDLSELYGVETKRLNEQVKRNIERFPEDFMFQLSRKEFEILKSQNATSSWGGRRTLPYAFTEHGTVMLASVLKSKIAIEASIQIVKAFVKFREILASQAELAKKIDELENKYDDQFKQVFEAIRQLMTNQIQITTIKKGRKD
ncbi:ORF6N domain-containing protein [Flagellimonas sp.]|uniref:ORF6N domain-containing protein n=1 Tax=Flagellimonas sp. TaxID=2058762 RepID=UPI003BAF8EBC